PRGFGRVRLVYRPRPTANARVLVKPVTRAPALAPKETGGSPEFPDYPSEHMPRSQIPAVSHPADLGAGRTAAFQSLQLSALGPVARTYPLSTTIHFSGFNSAACVLTSPLLRTPSLDGRTSVRLPTRWLAFGRVGLVGCRRRTHWVTMTSFKGCHPYSNVPSLSRHEQRMIRYLPTVKKMSPTMHLRPFVAARAL